MTWIADRAQRGAIALELGLVLPVLVIILGAIIDLGNAYRIRVELQEAVQEGGAYAVQNRGNQAQTILRVQQASSNLTPASVTVTCTGANPTVVTVTAVHTHQWMIGIVFNQPLQMTAQFSGDVLSGSSCVSG